MPAIAEPVARGLFRRAKAAMKGENTAEKLKTAQAELRVIIQQEHDSTQKTVHRAARVSNLLATARELGRAAWDIMESGTDEQAAHALRDWAVAQVAEEKLRDVAINLQRGRYLEDHQAQVLAANPGAKAILSNVVGAFVTNTSAELKGVTAQEQGRLDQEHGVGEYAAEDSQVVKRVASRLEWLQKVKQRVADEPIAVTWPLFARELSEL
jgi:hypothetical protein